MPLSLSMYLYKRLQEKLQKDFEEKNKILGPEDIDTVFTRNDPRGIVRILKSAVISHEPVDGVPYYLKAPVTPMFYHDNFKRCMIADGFGRIVNCEEAADITGEVLLILNKLKEPEAAGYVKVFAWRAVGRWGKHSPDAVYQRQEQNIQKAFEGSTADLLGVLLFLEQMKGKVAGQEIKLMMKKGEALIKYRAQKALMNYYLMRNGLGSRNNLRPEMKAFLNKCRKGGYMNHACFYEGLRSIGLIGFRQKAAIGAGTQQDDIICRLKKFSGEYVHVLGLFQSEFF